MQPNPIQPHTDVTWFRDLVLLDEEMRKRVDELDKHIREALGAAYQQGFRDAVEHRTNEEGGDDDD